MSFVINTTDALKPYLRAGQVVSLESTTYPGTTEEELLPRVQEGGLKVGEDIFLVYSPEREDPGNPNFELVPFRRLLVVIRPSAWKLVSPCTSRPLIALCQ